MRATTLPVVSSTLRDFSMMVGQGAIRDLRRARVGSLATSVPRTRFDPTAPEVIRDPFPPMERLRAHPVHVNEKLNVWMMARHEDVTAAARAHDVLSSGSGILLRSTVLPSVATTDDPDHARLRRVTAPYFTPSAMRRLEGSLAQFVDPSVDALARGEVIDMVPALTIAARLGDRAPAGYRPFAMAGFPGVVQRRHGAVRCTLGRRAHLHDRSCAAGHPVAAEPDPRRAAPAPQRRPQRSSAA